MLDVKRDGKRVILDLRESIQKGEHPRNKVFEYVKKAEIGTVFEIHTPRKPNPLIKGLEQLGMNVIVNEIEPGNVRVTTVKLTEM